MSNLQSPYVSVSLVRLRRGITLCCWIAGLSLLTQLSIWAVATFMDVRFQELAEVTPGQLIVGNDMSDRPMMAAPGETTTATASTVNPNRVVTQYEVIMDRASEIAYGTGMIGIIMLVPLLGLGALMGAASCTPGVEKTVSAFMWSLLIVILMLPIGEVLGLPWREGALVSYDKMIAQVELQMAGGTENWGTPTFYARFAVLPLACIVGLTIIGMGFSAGVTAGIIREDIRLDPALEREAANITPGSLHGGRAAVALRAASAAAAVPVATAPAPAKAVPQGPPSITQLSPGEAPRRLI